MRYGRAKAARRTLQFFRLQHNVKPPYHVVLDGTFLLQVIQQKVPLPERLDRVLQHGQVILYVCRSSLNELESLSQQEGVDEVLQERLRQARQWGLDECHVVLEAKDIPTSNKRETPTMATPDFGTAGQDVWDLVASSKEHMPRYLVATQEEILLDALRQFGTVPLLRLSRGVLLLEQPSKAAQQRASTQEYRKWTGRSSVNDKEQAFVQRVKELGKQQHTQSQNEQSYNRGKTKAKGPNPLSCKKKRTEEESSRPNESSGRRKRRRKNKSGDKSAL